MAGKEAPDIYCWETDTDSLRVYLASTKKGALRVGLSLNEGPDCVAYFAKVYPEGRLVKDEYPNRTLMDAVEAALNNGPAPKNLCLDITGTPFQRRVWETIRKIPFGQTRTYGEVAVLAGCPGGARAIGQAMNRNPLPAFYP